ncbi:MAG: hypothetical protein UX44_C0032G0006 [candidate division WWE3 bacterium GW2011_GWA1_46_21]|uniref:Uncharacterized protein n=1 Tax=candidate division WWE3 bacterium GW2011_GWA1_46_21 TaxID=1619107 RepID=A0A0G1PAC0_UNCKA|nr:MAG: hypothetical protein UX44_C0032G0006 [candidate division WWE3 bacterium GW2011_GWA1_46_21]
MGDWARPQLRRTILQYYFAAAPRIETLNSMFLASYCVGRLRGMGRRCRDTLDPRRRLCTAHNFAGT